MKIEETKPDLIVFDNIQALVAGDWPNAQAPLPKARNSNARHKAEDTSP